MKPSYEGLEVTQLARDLIKEVYVVTKFFPNDEKFGLISQLRRSAMSVLLNIAEGSMKNSKLDFARFIRNSLGSLIEVDAAIKISRELDYMQKIETEKILGMISPLYFKLIGLDKYLRK